MATRLVRAIWGTWENVFRAAGRVRPLKPGETYLFCIAKRRYFGRPFTVDGILVRRFEPIIELHMNNDLLLKELREQPNLVGLAVKLLQEMRRALPVLAERAASSEFEYTRVLLGITFVHRGVERFGFHALPLRHPVMRALASWHLRRVYQFVNPGADTLFETHASAFVPKLVVISKQRLMEQVAKGDHLANPTTTPAGRVLT